MQVDLAADEEEEAEEGEEGTATKDRVDRVDLLVGLFAGWIRRITLGEETPTTIMCQFSESHTYDKLFFNYTFFFLIGT